VAGKVAALVQDAHYLDGMIVDPVEDHVRFNVVAPIAETNVRTVSAKGGRVSEALESGKEFVLIFVGLRFTPAPSSEI
jgi:hypothetical protein